MLLGASEVTDKNAVVADKDVQDAVKYVEEQLAGNGRILLRKSGTEPLIRVMVEAMGENMCQALADKVVDAINKKGYSVNS